MKMRYIYMDHAATAGNRPESVVKSMTEQMYYSGNAGRGGHNLSLRASGIVYEARKKMAALLHAQAPENIAFTYNATESLNIAIKGCLNPGDHVITTVLEHNSVLRPLYELREQGVLLSIIDCDTQGNLNWQALSEAIRPETRAVVCTHASNVTGNCIDLDRMDAFIRENDLLWILDASQTAGSLNIDVSTYDIDILCFTGHKGLMGPQGTGGIYVRAGLQIRALKSGGSGFDSFNEKHPLIMPELLEAGTLNVHGLAGLSAALDFIMSVGTKTIHDKEIFLMRRFLEGIQDINGIKIYGDFSTDKRAPIVSLNIGEEDASEVADLLNREYHICVRSGAHCAPLMHRALGTERQGTIRFSFSFFNTEEEIDQAIEALKEVL